MSLPVIADDVAVPEQVAAQGQNKGLQVLIFKIRKISDIGHRISDFRIVSSDV